MYSYLTFFLGHVEASTWADITRLVCISQYDLFRNLVKINSINTIYKNSPLMF